MKKQLLQEINRQKEMMGVLSEQTNAGATTSDIIEELKELLETWEEKTYESDEARWNAYHEDVEELVEKHSEATGEWKIPQEPGAGVPSLEYQIANPDSLETME